MPCPRSLVDENSVAGGEEPLSPTPTDHGPGRLASIEGPLRPTQPDRKTLAARNAPNDPQ